MHRKKACTLKNRLKIIGTVDVDITELQDYHLYSHKGRGKKYNHAIEKKHKYAIAFTVEMNKDMLDMAPYGPTLMKPANSILTGNHNGSGCRIYRWAMRQ